MGFRIVPSEAVPTEERERKPEHLAWIRQLVCTRCLVGRTENFPIEAAHVRMNDASRGKLEGMGQKPSDKYVVPLCGLCHRDAPFAQHKVGEVRFWKELRIDPLKLSEALWGVSGDVPAGNELIYAAAYRFPWLD